MIIFNLSIVSIVIAFVIAIIQIIIYRKDTADSQCRSKQLNLGLAITSIVMCTIWLVLMIIFLVKNIPEDKSSFSIM